MIRRVLERARAATGLVRAGHSGRVLHAIRLRASATHVAIGLRRDLRVAFPLPRATIQLDVRPLEPDDDLWFLRIRQPGTSNSAAYVRLAQRHLVESGFPCWVAVAPDGKPCFMQFLLTSRDNDRIREEWGGLLPELAENEVLFEAAYTAEHFRLRGVMPHVMSRIAEVAGAAGARWALTFAEEKNSAAVRSCMAAGFTPYVRRYERWRMFRRTVVFAALPTSRLLVERRPHHDVPDQQPRRTV